MRDGDQALRQGRRRRQGRHAERHDAADGGRARPATSTRCSALIDAGADVNAEGIGVRGQTPLMFAAASNRAAVIELLAATGADLKATSKVTDLASLTREGAGFWRQSAAYLAAGAAPDRRRRAGRAGRSGRRQVALPRVAAADAGIDRNYQLNELIVAQGGLTPLLYAVRQGYVGIGRWRCSRPAPTSIRSRPATRRARC